jgi:hypothetical protein
MFVHFRIGSLTSIRTTLPRDVGTCPPPIGMERPIPIRDSVTCSAIALAKDRVPQLTLGLQKGIQIGMAVMVRSPLPASFVTKDIGVGITVGTEVGAETIKPRAQ